MACVVALILDDGRFNIEQIDPDTVQSTKLV